MSAVQRLPRSRLYRLLPQGLGTPLVESLSSLASRLAEAHCVRVGVLLSHEVGPSISSRAFDIGHMWVQVGHTMNGQGDHARRCVKHLEQLTQQKGLEKLTFLPWASILGSTHLLRTHKAWCPQCLSEWKAADKIIYEPLLWACAQVQVCPIHNAALMHHCPHPTCDTKMPALTSWPGYCPRCRGWLGRLPTNQGVNALVDESEHNYWRWAAQIIGGLLRADFVDWRPYPRDLSLALSACAYHVQRQSRKDGRSLIPGYPFSRLKEMAARIGGIQLDTLLYICYHLRVTPSFFLNEYVIASHTMEVPPSPNPRRQSRRPHHRHGSLPELGMRFEAMLKIAGVPVPSLAEAARRLDTTTSALYKYFRPLCITLQARKAGYVNEEKRKIEALRQEAQRAAMRFP